MPVVWSGPITVSGLELRIAAVIYRVYNDDLQAVFEAKERGNQLPDRRNKFRNLFCCSCIVPAISGTEIRPGMALSPNISGATGNEKSTVYRIDSNHTVLPWWSNNCSARVRYDNVLTVNPLLACGGNGYIYAIEGPDAGNTPSLQQANHLLFACNPMIIGLS